MGPKYNFRTDLGVFGGRVGGVFRGQPRVLALRTITLSYETGSLTAPGACWLG